MSSLEACSPDPSWGPGDHTTRGTLEHDNMGLYYTIPKYGLSHHLSWIVAKDPTLSPPNGLQMDPGHPSTAGSSRD